MRQVVLGHDTNEVLLDEVTSDNGYVMLGNKGNYILAKDTAGKFIWVKATPGSVTKPVKAFDTMKDAIADKLSKGYEVLEYTSVDFE